jgi:hypothetical protein
VRTKTQIGSLALKQYDEYIIPFKNTNMASSQIVLFFSNHCQHSMTFLNELKRNNITITTVCVDNTPRHRIPGVVRSVPTLIVAGEEQPRVGEAAFQWLNQQAVSQNQHTPPNHPQHQQHGQGQPATTVASDTGPVAWQLEEMGNSFSDGYSFIESHTGSSIPKNFSFLEDTAAAAAAAATQSGNAVTTPHAPPAVQQREDDLTQRMESLQTRRDSDFQQTRLNSSGGDGNMRFDTLPTNSRS